MKDIDLLPEWYKSGRRRQSSYRTQYIALGGIFVVMVVWNFVSIHSVSKVTAALAQAELKQRQAEGDTRTFGEIKNEATELKKKAKFIKEIDSRIDVASVLAEISFLIDKRIALSKVDFKAVRFEGKPSSRTGNAVRAARGSFAGKKTLLLGDVRFRVVISGVAADAGEVAKLIRKLEDSPYFCLIYPSFSRNKKFVPAKAGVKAGTNLAGKDFQVSEFEISCYLANYREEQR